MSLPFWQNPLIREPLVVSLGAIGGALSRHYLIIFFFGMYCL